MAKRSDLAGQVLAKLKQEIILGERSAGEHLAEEKIAAELNLSRIPVREALRQLAQDGLAYTLPNGRTHVNGLSEQDLKDLYRLRLQLESMALELAVVRATDEELALPEQIVQNMVAGDRGFELDVDLHRQIVLAAHCHPLTQLWNSLSDTTMALVSATRMTGFHQEELLHQHKEIARALHRRDADLAIHWLAIHLMQARDIVLQNLRSR